MRFCKYCGAQISETALRCQNCGKKIRHTNEREQDNGAAIRDSRNSRGVKYVFLGVAAAFICICVIILTANFDRCKADGCNNKAVSGSDYCYSHKCAIDTCNNARSGYSNYCYSHYLLYDNDTSKGSYHKPVYSYELKISNVKITSNSVYTVAEGTITNNSDTTVSCVEIKGAFKTSSGVVVDTDWTYAVGSEGLSPGESSKWEMSVSKDRSITNCTVTVLDFDY